MAWTAGPRIATSPPPPPGPSFQERTHRHAIAAVTSMTSPNAARRPAGQGPPHPWRQPCSPCLPHLASRPLTRRCADTLQRARRRLSEGVGRAARPPPSARTDSRNGCGCPFGVLVRKIAHSSTSPSALPGGAVMPLEPLRGAARGYRKVSRVSGEAKPRREQPAAGGRRQAAGGRRQAAGGRRQAAGGRRQAAGGRRQAAGGRRQAAGGRRQAAAGGEGRGFRVRNRESVEGFTRLPGGLLTRAWRRLGASARVWITMHGVPEASREPAWTEPRGLASTQRNLEPVEWLDPRRARRRAR